MSAPGFVPIRSVDVEIFHWISEDFDLLVGLEEKLNVRSDPLGTMNIFTKFFFSMTSILKPLCRVLYNI